MKTICAPNIPNYNCWDDMLCKNFSEIHRKKYSHSNKINCKEDLYCDNFTKHHYNTFAHPNRDNADEHKSNNLKYCDNGEKCKDFTQLHIANFKHPIRKRKCLLFPCRLLHDNTHLLEFTHKKHYEIISNNNFKYNLLHFLCDDIWKEIIRHIKLSCYYFHFLHITNDGRRINQFKDLNSFEYTSTISKLLMTSKMFKKILNTNLFSVDDWCEKSNVTIYKFTSKYKICKKCYKRGNYCVCSALCSRCGDAINRKFDVGYMFNVFSHENYLQTF